MPASCSHQSRFFDKKKISLARSGPNAIVFDLLRASQWEGPLPLVSKLLSRDQRLVACATNDSAHVTLGSTGEFVLLIQKALLIIDGPDIADAEIGAKLYGQTTAAAVLAYKRKRAIININYQHSADDIVGKMTIASLDRDMSVIEAKSRLPTNPNKWSISTLRGLRDRG